MSIDRAEIEAIIDLAIKKSISEYKRSGLLKESNDIIYEDVSIILTNYYGGNLGKEQAETVRKALEESRRNMYFEIIPQYYQQAKTIETIAEYFGVDVSTIVRNKKRLCIEIYAKIF